PGAGAVIVTTGGAFVVPTRTTIVALPARPPASVTLAVTVCRPSDSVAVTEGPVPSAPSRLDDHRMRAPRFPSCASRALPANVNATPGATFVRGPGAVMRTIGAVFCARSTTRTGFAVDSRLW